MEVMRKCAWFSEIWINDLFRLQYFRLLLYEVNIKDTWSYREAFELVEVVGRVGVILFRFHA